MGEYLVYNTYADLLDFFSTPDRPVNTEELAEFWRSLSFEDELYFRHAPIN